MTVVDQDLRKALQGAPFSRSIPLSQQAYEVLRNAIIDLHLAPGTLLRKDQICEVLGISRTPIGEALTRLSEEGLVDILPQRGTFVSRIALESVYEGAFIRRALESAAARQLATRLTDDVISQFDRNLRFQVVSVEAGDITGFHRLDQEFHAILCNSTGFPRITRLVESSRAQLDRVRFLILPTPGRLRQTLDEHFAIFDALKSGDEQAAGQAVEVHLDQTPKRLDLLIAERPELFENPLSAPKLNRA